MNEAVIFEPEDIISVYTRQQAIEDGIFIDVSEVAKSLGFLISVAITTNLYNTHIKKDEEDRTINNLSVFLKKLRQKMEKDKSNDNLLYFQFNFSGIFDPNDLTDVWVAFEAESPTNNSMALNCFLPEDY